MPLAGRRRSVRLQAHHCRSAVRRAPRPRLVRARCLVRRPMPGAGSERGTLERTRRSRFGPGTGRAHTSSLNSLPRTKRSVTEDRRLGGEREACRHRNASNSSMCTRGRRAPPRPLRRHHPRSEGRANARSRSRPPRRCQPESRTRTRARCNLLSTIGSSVARSEWRPVRLVSQTSFDRCNAEPSRLSRVSALGRFRFRRAKGRGIRPLG